MPDAATQARQAELEKRHRDLTKPVPPLGSDGDSLRSIRGFENITDQDLQHRATFNLKDHLAGKGSAVAIATPQSGTVDLSSMTRDQLLTLAESALGEAARKPETENENA